MDEKRTFIEVLQPHIPESAVSDVAKLLEEGNVRLRISRARFSKAGDYCSPQKHAHHRISVNGDLNPYAFLITLVHEIAHMRVWNEHGARVRGHGREWKREFGNLLIPFLQRNVFPDDIAVELDRHLSNPRASTLCDVRLQTALIRSDSRPGIRLIDLEIGARFRLKNKKNYEKLAASRKYFQCRQVPGGKRVRIHPLAEVEVL
jgi:hypothetical protein